MPIPDRPASQTLKAGTAYYDNIVRCVNFADGSGNTATDLKGVDNITLGGSAGTDFEWLSGVLGGGAVRRITTGGTIKFSDTSGATYDEGTIVIVARRTNTTAFDFVYQTGCEDSDNPDGETYIQCDTNNIALTHRPTTGVTGDDSLDDPPEDEWAVYVLTWESTTAEEMTLFFGHPSAGKITLGPVDCDTGIVILSGDAETLGGWGGSDPIDNPSWDIAFYLRLDVVLDTGDEDLYLDDPFLNMRGGGGGGDTGVFLVYAKNNKWWYSAEFTAAA